jgi:hypothetical protein
LTVVFPLLQNQLIQNIKTERMQPSKDLMVRSLAKDFSLNSFMGILHFEF